MRQLTASIGTAFLALAIAAPAAAGSGVDSNVIRLRPAEPESPVVAEPEAVEVDVPRRGFDYAAFETHLESLWFQRKTLLASGNVQEATQQLEKIRAFCTEEGVRRLEPLAGALIAEAHRYYLADNTLQALSALEFAEAFDPGRPQIHLGRAAVYWRSRAVVSAAVELLAAVRGTIVGSLQDLRLFHRMAFIGGVSLILAALVYALLMVVRHNTPLRHEVEEWSGHFLGGRWPAAAGWIVLGLPLLLWFGAGWAAVYWLALTFRFMTRGERLTTVALLLAGLLVSPGYGVAVGLYGTTADPAVRATLKTAGGEYDPDRIVRLRRLVEAHPEDPVYRFLLAGQYKNGRYFEESFDEYRRVLEVDPTRTAAYVNIGNIFLTTGQYAEAIANYRRALELDENSFLAHFNLHLAQSEDFRFGEAEQSLARAREIDPDRAAALLAEFSGWDRPAARDDSLRMASLWDAAVSGRGSVSIDQGEENGHARPRFKMQNPFSVVCSLALFFCLVSAVIGRGTEPARRCIRCGRPFCHHCKSGREAREYCSQCLHLYVLRDGLAPATKSKKMYEVERHEIRTRRTRRFLSAIIPGAVHVLRGKTGRGLPLLLVWCACLVSVSSLVLMRATRGGWSLADDVLNGSLVVPTSFEVSPFAVLALLALPAVWLVGNLWQFRRKEA